MKKLVFLLGTIMLVTVLFSSCQKEQAASTEDTAAASERVVGVAGNGPYEGSINSSYAASLAANYAKKYGDDEDQSQKVAFKAKDLIAFITGLQAKHKSDIIYINFGVYGKGAAPVKSKDYGRLTVFLTGNNMPAATYGRRNDGILEDLDQFLNHADILP